MSINSVLNTAVSGLNASQTAMRTASNNIANLHTPGYARAQTMTAPSVLGGVGAGVEVSEVRRIADQFLQRASLRAASDAAGAQRAFAMLNQLQSQFGSLDDPGSLFNLIDSSVAPFAALANAASSAGDRAAVTAGVQATLDEFTRLSAQMRDLRSEADMRVAQGVTRANALLADIAGLNEDIQRARVRGDASGSENAQAALIDELATLLDVRVSARAGGGVEVRTESGFLLVGHGAATLDYVRGAGAGGAYGQIMALGAHGGVPQPLDPHLRSGELAALVKLRDGDIPAVMAQLGELAAGWADALNAAHNSAAAVPAPNVLDGRNTGLLATDALGFSGRASIGAVDAGGVMTHRIDIDFDAGTLSLDGGPATAFPATVGGFAAALNAQLGAVGGGAGFADGRLTLNAGPGQGLAIQEDGADRAGRGLSHVFGLNDLLTSDRPGFFETGLSGGDLHGFAPGQSLTFRVSGGAGGATDIAISIGGATIDDLLAQLNNPVTGMGRYASFTLDARGALVMTPAAGAEALQVDLTQDMTARGGTGLRFSDLFGVGEMTRAGRAQTFSLRADIAANPMRLSAAAPDLRAAAIGDFVLGGGDGRGAQAMHEALRAPRAFAAAGAIAGAAMSVTDYAGRLAGDVGARAARSERAEGSAQALMAAATEQRSAVEGVNLDEELANMAMYQQSYNASARLIQAAKEMIDALLNAV